MSALYDSFLKNYKSFYDIRSDTNTYEETYPFNSEFSKWNRQETTEVSSIQNKTKKPLTKKIKKRKQSFKGINVPNKRSRCSFNSNEILSQLSQMRAQNFKFPQERDRNFDMQRIIYTKEQVKESIKKFKAVKWNDYWKNFEEYTKEYDDFTPIEERCTIS